MKKFFFKFSIKDFFTGEMENIYGLKELPRFAVKNKRIPDSSKQNFANDFLTKYMNDDDFKHSVKEHVILFKNFQYSGCYKSAKETMKYVNRGEVNFCYEIDGEPLFQF